MFYNKKSSFRNNIWALSFSHSDQDDFASYLNGPDKPWSKRCFRISSIVCAHLDSGQWHSRDWGQENKLWKLWESYKDIVERLIGVYWSQYVVAWEKMTFLRPAHSFKMYMHLIRPGLHSPVYSKPHCCSGFVTKQRFFAEVVKLAYIV